MLIILKCKRREENMNKQLKNQVLEYIEIQKNVSSHELCDRFHLSESTCRRLLLKLQDEDKITRYRGGALAKQKNLENTDLSKRFTLFENEKEAIAREAAKLVSPNSTIMLMGGTTVYRMCKYLKNMHLTVITNSMIVFSQLQNQKGIQLILLGGIYVKEEEELSGVLTNTNSKLFTCDHLFMGAAGYIRNAGFTTSDLNSLELYSWCIALSEKVHLLFDSSKFSARGKAITVSNTELSSCISDSKMPADLIEEIESYGVNVMIADESEENE